MGLVNAWHKTTGRDSMSGYRPWDPAASIRSTLKNQVAVRSPQDLANIDPDTLYFIDGTVDMTGSGISIEVPAGGFNIDGYNFNVSKIICSDPNYTLFTSPVGGSGDILGEGVTFDISGTSSKCFDLVANTGFEAIEWSRCNWENNTSRGEINGYRQGLESGTGYFGGSPDLTLSGTWTGGYFVDTSIVRNIDPSMIVPLFRAGAGFSMASRFRSNQNVDLNATSAYLDFAPANFPNPSTLQLEECLVSRNGVFDASDATILPNITKADLASAFTGNIGIRNTFEGGRATITTEAITLISDINIWTDAAGTWTATDLEHYSQPVNGQIRHDGVSPDEYEAAVNVQIEGPQNDIVSFKLVKWDSSASIFVDVLEADAVVNAFAGVRDVAFITETANVTLDQNDYLKAQVRNTSSTGNLTLELGSFYRVKER